MAIVIDTNQWMFWAIILIIVLLVMWYFFGGDRNIQVIGLTPLVPPSSLPPEPINEDIPPPPRKSRTSRLNIVSTPEEIFSSQSIPETEEVVSLPEEIVPPGITRLKMSSDDLRPKMSQTPEELR